MKEFKFVLGEDYYLEKGNVILTEEYLAKRGSCCGSGCRHCPYWPMATKGNTQLKEINKKDLEESN
jgi:hypothetical protein